MPWHKGNSSDILHSRHLLEHMFICKYVHRCQKQNSHVIYTVCILTIIARILWLNMMWTRMAKPWNNKNSARLVHHAWVKCFVVRNDSSFAGLQTSNVCKFSPCHWTAEPKKYYRYQREISTPSRMTCSVNNLQTYAYKHISMPLCVPCCHCPKSSPEASGQRAHLHLQALCWWG